MSLLLKFDSVQPATQGLLSQADIGFCQGAERDYQKMISHIDVCAEALEKLHQELLADKLTLSSQASWINGFGFNSKDEAHLLRERKIEVLKTYTERITDHFNKTYHLKLERFAPKNMAQVKQTWTLPWKEITDSILAQVGGDLQGGTIKTLIDALHNEFGYSSSVVQKGAVVYFNNVFRLVDNCRIMGTRLAYSSNSDVRLLDRVLSYFETQSHTIIPCIETVFARSREVSYPFSIEELDVKRIRSVKLFKNQRVDIFFHSPQEAQEFFAMFKLNEITSHD